MSNISLLIDPQLPITVTGEAPIVPERIDGATLNLRYSTTAVPLHASPTAEVQLLAYDTEAEETRRYALGELAFAPEIVNAKLAPMPTVTIKANIAGTPEVPDDVTLTAFLDAALGSDVGTLLVRGSSSWAAISGASGTILQGNGAGNPLTFTSPAGLAIADGSIEPVKFSDAAILRQGQCQLDLSGGNLRLLPFNGNRLAVNGVNCVVPSAGVTLAATGTTPGLLYYIYATQSGGTINALVASTTAPATHTDGTQIETGTPARALVGMASPITGPAWVDSNAQGLVASYFNRRCRAQNITTTTLATTASGSFIELLTAMRAEWLSWADEIVDIAVTTTGNVAGTAQQATGIGIDNATNLGGLHYQSSPNNTSVSNSYAGFVTVGRHDSRVLGRSSASQTANFVSQTQKVVTIR